MDMFYHFPYHFHPKTGLRSDSTNLVADLLDLREGKEGKDFRIIFFSDSHFNCLHY